MHKHFISLATDLDVLPPKTAEDIFKSHLEESKIQSSQIDSSKANLATTYVNAFVNAAYG
jgi:26S proteasome regulatory subunit N1